MPERQNTDGRVARGKRTRQAVLDAHVAMLGEGVLRPTAKKLADRAGISLRTFWSNFPDMETLLRATTEYWLERDAGNWTPIPADLPLAERIERFCTQRAARMEDLAPAAASAVLGEPYSPALQASRRQNIDRAHRDLIETFGPEIGDDPRSPRNLALLMAASGTSWAVLRSDEGLTVAEATEVMATTFRAVLGAE